MQFPYTASAYNQTGQYGQSPYVAPNMQILWVKGKAEAESYQLPNGSSVVLMDSEKNVFYIKSRDVNGIYQPVREFEYTELKQLPQDDYATKNDLNLLSSSVDELRKMIEELIK